MTNPTCPETGQPMFRDVRPMTITYKGHEATFDMPGWYCDASEESIHTSDDMKISDRALNRLKAKVEGLLEPEAPDQEAPAPHPEGCWPSDRWRAQRLPEIREWRCGCQSCGDECPAAARQGSVRALGFEAAGEPEGSRIGLLRLLIRNGRPQLFAGSLPA